MQKMCKVTLNKETFYANVGDVLLDGAIMSGAELQHDCRSGICGPSLMTHFTGLFDGSSRKNAEGLRGHVTAGLAGWGGRDRTSEWRNQNPLIR
jgi:hypothetical protein